MNKSEIAERAAREIRHLVICEDCKTRGIPGTKKFNWPLCDWCIREVDKIQPVIEYVCKFVERAIAESQVPCPHLNRISSIEPDSPILCTDCDTYLPKTELGDGEPSIFFRCGMCEKSFSNPQAFMEHARKCKDETHDAAFYTWRSGAAQEVSPPSPVEILKSHWVMEILCDHWAETDQALCACGWRGPACPNVGDAAASWANHVAELMQTGDTRELAAFQEWSLDNGGTVCISEADAFRSGFRAGLGNK